MFRSKALSSLSVAFIALAQLLHAQQGRGTILGSVTDPSSAAIAGAKVGITNVDTNLTVTTQTNGAGFFTTPPVNVGQYRVTIESAGFKREVRSGIVLEVDQSAQINVQLQVGAASESVEVVEEAPLVNAENPTLGQVIENDFVKELPLNGGNALALALLATDVHSTAGPVQSGFADRGTSLADLSINGGPNSVNNLLVDGMVAQNSYY